MTEPAQTGSPLDAQKTQNWKLTLAYEGTDFSGWQIQPGERTVQGELQAALRRVTGEAPLPQGSGRTDAGVHALGQAASFELQADIPAGNLQLALNRTLPAAIRITAARIAPGAFHARHSALAKTYEYRVFRARICPPFLARYVHACAWPMDMEAMQAAARLFEGVHDFRSFAATDPDLKARTGKAGTATALTGSPRPAAIDDAADDSDPEDPMPIKIPGKHGSVRTVYSSSWEEQSSVNGSLLVYRVRGNGFLHHMVRNLVGTMLDVGRGQTQLEQIPEILKARARAAAGPTAPAQGLYLHSVDYGGADEFPAA